jgi:hypothetical protein
MWQELAQIVAASPHFDRDLCKMWQKDGKPPYFGASLQRVIGMASQGPIVRANRRLR